MFGFDLRIQDSNLVDLSFGEIRRDIKTLDFKTKFGLLQRGYQNSIGNENLRSIIKEKLCKYKAFKAIESNIYICNGAIHALDLILRSCIKKDDEVLIPDISFPPYKTLISSCQGKIVPYSFKFQENKSPSIDIKSVEQRITNKTKFIILNFPHNPLGSVLEEEDAIKLCNLIEKHKQLLYISDEVYTNYDYTGKNVSIADYSDKGYVINSLSKSHQAAGIRIGWIYGKNNMLENLQLLLFNSTGCVNSLSQILAIDLIKNHTFNIESYKSARNLAFDVLKSQGISSIKPDSGIFMLIKCQDDVELVKQLKEKKIFVVPGNKFGLIRYIRVSFALPDKNIKNGFSRLAQCLKISHVESDKRNRR